MTLITFYARYCIDLSVSMSELIGGKGLQTITLMAVEAFEEQIGHGGY